MSNARLTAACRSPERAPLALISTKVPSSGRARRTLSQAGVIEGEDTFDAFGHMTRRERGAGDVADILVELDRILARLADELCEPAPIADLAAIGFAIFQDLDMPDATVRIERHRVIDHQMLADHVVDDEEADHVVAREG